MGKAIDLTGQRFGRLTVIERDFQYPIEHNLKGGHSYWKCKCDCGNTTTVESYNLRKEKTQSCGCLQKERTSKSNRSIISPGDKFNYLTVIREAQREKHSANDRHIYWLCQCKCGNYITVPSNNLLSKHTTSCGCYKNYRTSQVRGIDLKGKKIGMLTVLELDEEKTQQSRYRYWKCKCDCGNIISKQSAILLSNRVYSCGCLTESVGAHNIQKVLIENNIDFEKEKTFSNFVYEDTKRRPRYDFYLPKYNRLIEFDGEQHYKETNSFFEETLETVQQRDQIKSNYAKNQGYSLVRIPYWEKSNITLDMILGDEYLI